MIQLQYIDLAPLLYGEVLVPPTVVRELTNRKTPVQVRDWVVSAPSWLKIRGLAGPNLQLRTALDQGEIEAITLALEIRADLLLIDEFAGRREARRMGLKTTGILGFFIEAHNQGKLDGRFALTRLRNETGFRISNSLQQQYLDLLG